MKEEDIRENTLTMECRGCKNQEIKSLNIWFPNKPLNVGARWDIQRLKVGGTSRQI